ncbi:replicative DNA helicase [endosymbiont of Sipalinus gigas]|uniref:replicative DNA helicase n=1 Tax=endosymbiont of Sipalinus gigas TaxID=1972134 RepID=UPI000DC7364E|nr:replicative DNA helicase [endosymbiont of Sipalinus gigas]BBA85188.1 replicative DNA helicase [endosymbiont of Sipalinus gigas]
MIKNNNKLFLEKNNFKNIKIFPYSIEAEQSVLGGLMIDNSKWFSVIEIIDSDDFFNINHKMIFDEMKLLIDSRNPIDLITISDSLNKKKFLNSIGGFSYLAEISKNIPSVANILAYSYIIREKSIMRCILTISNEISDICFNPKDKNVDDIIDIVESKLFFLSDKRSKTNNNPKDIKKVLENTINNIKKICINSKKDIIGISTGYHDLDRKTLGLQKSDLIIIASRPSMGKTTFAINLCENISIIEKKPILIFSLEMSGEQIMIKILSSMSRIDQYKIKTGKLDKNDWVKMNNIYNILINNNNMYIDDSSILTPNDLRSKARKLFRENNGLSLIMIDYLQLIKIPSLSNNRTLEISEISRSLKSLAKELNIPIIALSQLNRSLELRSDKRPVNSDLRESGSIEQDADLIMFIYRDEVYNENSDFKGTAEIILGKHRNGPIGSIKLTFNSKLSRFDNYINIKY